MKTRSLRTLLLAAAMLLPALPANATVPAPLDLFFAYYFQASQQSDGTVFKGDVKRVRVNSKDLLALLSQQTGINFPKGARIVVDPSGHTSVTEKKGTFIVDTSAFVLAEFGDSLFQGSFNNETEQEKSTSFIAFRLLVNIPVTFLELELIGMAKEDFNSTKINKHGTQKSRGKTKCEVTGRGNVDGDLILGEGNVSLTGKETETDL